MADDNSEITNIDLSQVPMQAPADFGSGTSLLKKAQEQAAMEQSQTNNSTNYAQQQSPGYNMVNGKPWGPIPNLQDTVNDPTTMPMKLAAVNAAALENEAPLNAQQAAFVAGETVPMEPSTMGTGSSFGVSQPTQMAATEPSQAPTAAPAYPFEGSYKLAEKAIETGAKAGLELAQARETMANAKMIHDAKYAEDIENAQQNFDIKYQDKMDDLNANVKEYRALAGEKVIPGAFLARQDTQASIMTGLAIALGGLGSAFSGSNQNVGLELINKAIDRDVEAQRFNLDTKIKLKKYETDTNESILGKMREKFSDDKSAFLATKVAMLAMVEDKFNADVNKQNGYSRLATDAAKLQALSQIKSQREVYEMQLKQAQQSQFNMQEMLKGKDPLNLSNEEAKLLYGKDAEMYVQGFGPALSKEDKKAFQESYGESRASLQALDKLLSMDINKMDPVKRAEVATELNLLTGKMRLAVLGPGAMTEKEYDRLVETLGDPNAIVAFPGAQRKKLETVKNRLKTQQDSQVKQYFGRDRFNELEQRQGKINFK